MTFVRATIAACLLAALPGLAGATTIEGRWTADIGADVSVARCGAAYCATVASGPHLGKSVGVYEWDGQRFVGRAVSLRNGRAYPSTATFDGARLKVRACLGGFICRTRTYVRP